MLTNKYFYLFLLLLLFQFANAEIVNIGILNHKKVTSFIFSPQKGKYAVYTNKGKIATIDNTNRLTLNYRNNAIFIKSLDKDYGSFGNVKFIGLDGENSFKVKLVRPTTAIKYYQDNLLVKVNDYYNFLQLINNINLDNYVAGVVESEVGKSPPFEYFKLQSIICRTYALKNIDRHKAEGFSLCDGVHCQAYHGVPKSKLIKQAILSTKNIVIVDTNINLITATFYSNCGGQTANSEDVWHKNLYYLKSVEDTFCLHENNAVWNKKIPLKLWRNYLLKHNFPETTIDKKCSLAYFQPKREKYYEKQNMQIPFVDIRKDWKLKSTFFDVIPDGNYVLLKGKGFGHGVGLCQEGAMKMARLGYNYKTILHFYYKYVHLININAIDFFKTDF